jgi:hypothetical protein
VEVDSCGERGRVEREPFIAVLFILRPWFLWRFHRAQPFRWSNAKRSDPVPPRSLPIVKPESPGELKFLLESGVLAMKCVGGARHTVSPPFGSVATGNAPYAHLLEPENSMSPGIGAEICWKPVVNVRSRDRGVPGRDCQLTQIGRDIPHRIDALVWPRRRRLTQNVSAALAG